MESNKNNLSYLGIRLGPVSDKTTGEEKWHAALRQMSNRDQSKRPVCIVRPTKHETSQNENSDDDDDDGGEREEDDVLPILQELQVFAESMTSNFIKIDEQVRRRHIRVMNRAHPFRRRNHQN